MKNKYSKIDKEFEKLTNKKGFSNFECTNWKIDMYAKEILPFIHKKLDEVLDNIKLPDIGFSHSQDCIKDDGQNLDKCDCGSHIKAEGYNLAAKDLEVKIKQIKENL